MSDAGRHGLTIPLHAHTLREHDEIVREAEDLGYTDLWSFETAGIDAFSPLVHAAVHTRSARLGTAIVSSYTRGPAILAMSATAVDQVAPGRFVLGIGSSSPAIVEQWNGVPFERPLSSVRETVRRVRQALAGERMSLAEGQRGTFRLEQPPAQPVPVYIAALRARMLQLAGSAGDGVVLNFLPPRALATVLAEVRRGAETAGRDPESLDVVCRLMVCVEPMSQELAFAARFLLAVYLTSPVYEAFLRWLGYGPQLDPVMAAWAAGDRAAALAAIGDDLVADLLIIGDAATCRRRIDEYVAAGVRVPVLAPFSGRQDLEERRASVRRAVRELAPRR